MWRDLITSLTTDATFAPGATESSIAATEDALAVEFQISYEVCCWNRMRSRRVRPWIGMERRSNSRRQP